MVIRIPKIFLNEAGKEHYANEQAKAEVSASERIQEQFKAVQSIPSGWVYNEVADEEEDEGDLLPTVLTFAVVIAILLLILKIIFS